MAMSNRIGRKHSFIEDQRGAVAFEMPVIYAFLIFSLLLPLADVAIAGFKFISAHQALRDMAQRTQFSPPADVTTSAGITAWTTSLPTTIDGYSVSVNIYCGSSGTLAPCAADVQGNPPSSKYYTVTTSFTLSPMVLGSVLCSTCTLNFSVPFQ
jgi:Flp pilus assembly protein TadG